jgi:hypothetical protein
VRKELRVRRRWDVGDVAEGRRERTLTGVTGRHRRIKNITGSFRSTINTL